MRLHIIIPIMHLRKEFGWFYDNWKEDAVKTYIVNHPEIQSLIDVGLSLLGVGELEFSPQRPKQPHCLDLLFRKGRTFYAVEVKNRASQLQFAWRQLDEEVTCFLNDMKMHGELIDEIIPVLISVSEDITQPERLSMPM